MKNSLPASSYYIHRACFSALTLEQFYQVAQLRQDVFILEQQSIYSDLDGLDQQAMHFLCFPAQQPDAQLVGYARYRQGHQAHEFKIERVVLAKAARGTGLGKRLMQTLLGDIQQQCPKPLISLSAQLDAQAFYQLLGFVAQGDSYDDGGIEHITMHWDGK